MEKGWWRFKKTPRASSSTPPPRHPHPPPGPEPEDVIFQSPLRRHLESAEIPRVAPFEEPGWLAVAILPRRLCGKSPALHETSGGVLVGVLLRPPEVCLAS